MFGYHDVTDNSDSAMEQPLCWITNSFDRSPGELMWVPDDAKWGALNGKLLNLSYGTGKIFLVPHEKIDGQAQGGMISLGLDFPTGIMREDSTPKMDNCTQPVCLHGQEAKRRWRVVPNSLYWCHTKITNLFKNNKERY